MAGILNPEEYLIVEEVVDLLEDIADDLSDVRCNVHLKTAIQLIADARYMLRLKLMTTAQYRDELYSADYTEQAEARAGFKAISEDDPPF